MPWMTTTACRIEVTPSISGFDQSVIPRVNTFGWDFVKQQAEVVLCLARFPIMPVKIQDLDGVSQTVELTATALY